MNFKDILYLDVEFISSMYEEVEGESPSVQLTKTESMNAGIKALFASVGVRASETKSFNISTAAMLKKLSKELEAFPLFDNQSHDKATPSKYVKISGSLFATFKSWVSKSWVRVNYSKTDSHRPC
ncbi:hypothetical protein TUM4438_14690 [Shewanella sairae]|uniref:Uncharacterized protein n=1 Tax=Shewanella sairae TaxID=190310 RepID=A0ABQ4P9K9_9GAMM|nr:hypothetical protein [Shewanella sairae]MCL1129000.1 hypothetical protein [Shewanella sairae]GIU44146.1 hypothetical protein TUM4438_14690 [Shewanella sairae]